MSGPPQATRSRSLGPLAEIARRALPFPLAVFLAHVCLILARAYVAIPGLDLATHLGGGIAITVFFARTLSILEERNIIAHADRRVATVLLLALTASAALGWEFTEFVVDTCFGTRFQIDVADTMSDMALGILGGIAYLLVRRRPPAQ